MEQFQAICQDCLTQISEFHNFYLKVEQAYTPVNEVQEQSEYLIKSEPEIDAEEAEINEFIGQPDEGEEQQYLIKSEPLPEIDSEAEMNEFIGPSDDDQEEQQQPSRKKRKKSVKLEIEEDPLEDDYQDLNESERLSEDTPQLKGGRYFK